jgi:hypothetical protein
MAAQHVKLRLNKFVGKTLVWFLILEGQVQDDVILRW